MFSEYYFPILLALVWSFFASITDFKTREVPNWISYTLIVFAVTYRIFYSLYTSNYLFTLYGLIGIFIFVFLGFAFYYAGAFGGGDAKLIMGMGGILPFTSFYSIFYISFAFLITFFSIGVIYTLGYSFFLINSNKKFKSHFYSRVKNSSKYILGFFILGLLLFLYFLPSYLLGAAFFALGIMPFIYIYVKCVDEFCMVKTVDPSKLREGDWICDDIDMSGKIIRKTVHGLSVKDIYLLKKRGKKVKIRDGIPFTVVFFISLMVFFFLFLSNLFYYPF